MLLAPFSTDVHDYFSNQYYAVSPFLVRELGRVEWRLVPERKAPNGVTRGGRLLSALAEGSAVFRLECAPYRKPWHIQDERSFVSVARVVLEQVLDIDQAALHFDPQRAGRGIIPVGFVHSLRPGAYASSQWARPHHGLKHVGT